MKEFAKNFNIDQSSIKKTKINGRQAYLTQTFVTTDSGIEYYCMLAGFPGSERFIEIGLYTPVTFEKHATPMFKKIIESIQIKSK